MRPDDETARMTFGAEPHTRTTTELLESDDVDRLAAVLGALRGMRQPLGSIEPESDQIERRRFRSDRVVPTGYRLDLSVGVGDRNPVGPLPVELLFLVPAESAGFTEAQARAALGDLLPDGAGWEISDEFGPEAVHVTVPGFGPDDTELLARFAFGAMRALGATTPTGRWRCTWMRHRNDPEIPAA